jgi:hypothetical protein
MSPYTVLPLRFFAPILLALRLHRKPFLTGNIDFSVARHIHVEGFGVNFVIC